MSEKRVVSRNLVIVFIAVIILVWILYYEIGSPSFNKSNAVSIYGIVISAMSALLSVALAVVIFRIQSLENRNQSLEQSTLNYIFQITQVVYPQWSSSVEDDIKSKALSNLFYSNRLSAPKIEFVRYPTQQELERLRDEQQKRLEETLNLHAETDQRIHRTKNRFIISLTFLTAPIFISLFLLMVSDAFASWVTFYSVSFVILLSAFGVVFLLLTVLDSLP
jgi:hypothetical protein